MVHNLIALASPLYGRPPNASPSRDGELAKLTSTQRATPPALAGRERRVRRGEGANSDKFYWYLEMAALTPPVHQKRHPAAVNILQNSGADGLLC